MPRIAPLLVSPLQQSRRWETDGESLVFTRSFSFADFAAAATTVAKDIGGFPPFMTIEGAWAVFDVNFTGGAVATATFSAGTTSSVTDYIAATNVFSGATPAAPLRLAGVTLVPGRFLGSVGALPPAPGVGTIRVQLVVTGANTNALIAGHLQFSARMRLVSFVGTGVKNF